MPNFIFEDIYGKTNLELVMPKKELFLTQA